MSIINEALKKTQAEFLNKALRPLKPGEKKPVPPKALSPQPPLNPKSSTSRIADQKTINNTHVLFGVIIGFLVCILGVMIFFFSRIVQPITPAGSAKKSSAIAKKPAPTIEINGVMTQNKKNRALINGEIYEAGETVNGMKIINIYLDRVELLDGKKIRSFPVHKKP
jgi:hypothetical protein